MVSKYSQYPRNLSEGVKMALLVGASDSSIHNLTAEEVAANLENMPEFEIIKFMLSLEHPYSSNISPLMFRETIDKKFGYLVPRDLFPLYERMVYSAEIVYNDYFRGEDIKPTKETLEKRVHEIRKRDPRLYEIFFGIIE